MSIGRSIRRESDRTRLTKLVRDLLAGASIPAGARDLPLSKAAASMASVGLRRDVADQAMRDLHAKLEQPRGDIYSQQTAMRKLDTAYRQPWAGAFQRNGEASPSSPNVQPVSVTPYERPGKATQAQLDAPYTATRVLDAHITRRRPGPHPAALESEHPRAADPSRDEGRERPRPAAAVEAPPGWTSHRSGLEVLEQP